MRFLSWLVLLIACAAVAIGLGYFKYNEIQASIKAGQSFPEPVETVEVVVAQKTTFQPTTRVTGEVVATQTADLSNELAGRIVEVGFSPGERVTKGQLLLALDTSEESARLRAALADQEIARLGHDRAQRLVKRGAGSVEDRDRALAQFDAAKANTQTLQAIIDKKRIRAPFAATTSLHTLEVGQYLAANTTVARLVGDAPQVWVDFALPQQQANDVSSNQVTLIRNGETLGQATIIARDAAINRDSRNLSFRTLLDRSSNQTADPQHSALNRLYPGTLLSVDVAIGDEQDVVAVPATAVRRNSLGAVVYVVNTNRDGSSETQETRAERRSVTVGSAIEFDSTTGQQLVAITSGLVAGERIAANGAFKLRDGIKVNLLERAPAGLGQ